MPGLGRRNLLGLDIDGSAVRMVQLCKDGTGYIVTNAGLSDIVPWRDDPALRRMHTNRAIVGGLASCGVARRGGFENRPYVRGGLRKKEVTQQIDKVPLLGDLPLAGALFRFKGEETVNSELLVFVTPWIVEQPVLSEGETQAYKETEFKGPRPAYTGAEVEQD